MIFFDSRCTWHVSPDRKVLKGASAVPHKLKFRGRRIAIASVLHGGAVTLPDGKQVPAQPLAFTSVYNKNRTFFIVALPELWRPQWKPTDPKLEEFFLGVSAHELAHTTQIAELSRRAAALSETATLPENFNDDVLEERWKTNAEYLALFERERDLFFDAAAEKDDARARTLACEALDLVQQRHERFFTGVDEVYRTVDGLFLNLEGVGSWVQYEMARRDPANFTAEQQILDTKGRGTSWSQGEGLALLMLIDRFVPRWQRRLLAPELASPLTVLREICPPRP